MQLLPFLFKFYLTVYVTQCTKFPNKQALCLLPFMALNLIPANLYVKRNTFKRDTNSSSFIATSYEMLRIFSESRISKVPLEARGFEKKGPGKMDEE